VGSGVFSTWSATGLSLRRKRVSVPVWALGSFLLVGSFRVRRRHVYSRVSVPVWALGSFLPVWPDGTRGVVGIIGFSARVGSGVFSTSTGRPTDARTDGWFQCPCGLWGLFYPTPTEIPPTPTEVVSVPV